jgi:hypothetical protein
MSVNIGSRHPLGSKCSSDDPKINIRHPVTVMIIAMRSLCPYPNALRRTDDKTGSSVVGCMEVNSVQGQRTKCTHNDKYLSFHSIYYHVVCCMGWASIQCTGKVRFFFYLINGLLHLLPIDWLRRLSDHVSCWHARVNFVFRACWTIDKHHYDYDVTISQFTQVPGWARILQQIHEQWGLVFALLSPSCPGLSPSCPGLSLSCPGCKQNHRIASNEPNCTSSFSFWTLLDELVGRLIWLCQYVLRP